MGRAACVLLGLVAMTAMADESNSSVTPDSGSTYPIDLPTTLRLAGVRNLDVELARTAVAEAHANYTSALEEFLPTVVPAASYLHHSGRDQAVEGELIDVTKHSESAGVTGTAQIAVGEAVFQTLQSRQQIRAADAAQSTQNQDVSLIAAQQYLTLVNAGAVVDVVTEALAISQNYEQQLNEAVKIGTAFKGDAVRVETQSRRLQVDLTRAKTDRRLAASELAQTLHLDPVIDLIPAEREPAPLSLADPGATPDSLVRMALEQRPELAKSTALIAAAEENRKGVLFGPLIPTVGSQAFIGEQNGGIGGPSLNGGPRREYGVGLSWKIGPGGILDWGRIKASESQLTRAQITDEKVRDVIRREVVDAYTQVQSLFQQLRDARLNVSSAEETLRLTRGRKQLGVGTVLEDIQAQQELLGARRDLVTIVTQLNEAQYALLHSVGTPLKSP